MYFVYILQSISTKRFYIGQCDHLVERFHEHQAGYSASTRNRGPWWMPYYETFPSRTDAIKRELAIKNKKSSKSIRAIIKHNLPNLNIL